MPPRLPRGRPAWSSRRPTATTRFIRKAARTRTTTTRTSPARRRSRPKAAARRAPRPGARRAASRGLTPITSIQTLGAGSRPATAARHQGPRHRHRHRQPLRLELRRHLQGRLGHLDPGGQRATRRATTSSAIFVAGIRRDATNPEAVIGTRHHDRRAASRREVRPGRARAGRRRLHDEPDGAGGRPGRRRDDQLDRQRAAGGGRARPDARPRTRTRSTARTTARCRACA